MRKDSKKLNNCQDDLNPGNEEVWNIKPDTLALAKWFTWLEPSYHTPKGFGFDPQSATDHFSFSLKSINIPSGEDKKKKKNVQSQTLQTLGERRTQVKNCVQGRSYHIHKPTKRLFKC